MLSAYCDQQEQEGWQEEERRKICKCVCPAPACAGLRRRKNALLSEMRGSVGCFADNGSPPTALTEWQTSGEFVPTWYGEMLCLRECMFVRVSEFERCVCISVFSLFWGLTFVPIRKEMRAVLRCGAYGLLCESVLEFTKGHDRLKITLGVHIKFLIDSVFVRFFFII